MSTARPEFDVIVVGGGHAGVESAWACSNAGLSVAVVTLDASKIGVMSCNPAIGGLAKGQIVREVDALGGLMGIATDATGIMFKELNTSKGPAVRGPRAQCDKHAYARTVREMVVSRAGVTVFEGSAERLMIEEGADGGRRVRGALILERASGRAIELSAPSLILTTGTFMRGLMHEGERRTEGGRAGEDAATGISGTLSELGFELGRLKTGTPPRLARSSLDWDALDIQEGDAEPRAFSDLTDSSAFPVLRQVACRVTRTDKRIHEAISANIHRAPMFSGQIESVGPRYCPSIEDKVVRFPERTEHHVFLEPESHESDWVYCNGIATSLPRDVQDVLVRGMPGCAGAEILQYGYAVEYDMVRPHQIRATGETKLISGLFLAGQINGTSGYEEAAGQGLIAAINVILRARGDEDRVLGRDEAYIGVMMDDLVTKTPREPYRMFTSRAEHRLMLRADNSADRLTALGHDVGIVCDERWRRFETRREALDALRCVVGTSRVRGERLAQIVKRPKYSLSEFREDLGAAAPRDEIGRAAMATVLAECQYAGYIARQQSEVKRQAETERRRVPEWFDASTIVGLRAEAKEALGRFKPSTLGQAGRLEGVNPADMTLITISIERQRRERAGAV